MWQCVPRWAVGTRARSVSRYSPMSDRELVSCQLIMSGLGAVGDLPEFSLNQPIEVQTVFVRNKIVSMKNHLIPFYHRV